MHSTCSRDRETVLGQTQTLLGWSNHIYYITSPQASLHEALTQRQFPAPLAPSISSEITLLPNFP